MASLLMLLALAQTGPLPERSGLFAYRRPTGWQAQPTPDGGGALIPPDGSGALVRFLPPETWAGTPEAYHAALHAAVRQGAPVLSESSLERFGAFLRSEAVIGAVNGPSLRLVLFTAAQGRELQGVFYAAPTDEAFAKHQAEADALVAGIRISPSAAGGRGTAAVVPGAPGPTPLPPAAREVRIVGLWLSGSTSLRYGLDGGGGFSTRLRSGIEILVLWENGLAYRGVHDAPILPGAGLMTVPEGLAAVDAAALLAQPRLADDRFGRWSDRGGAVEIPALRPTGLLLRKEGETLVAADGARWVRLPPLDGLRLEGTYVGAATAAAPEIRLALRKDGGFSEVNLVHALGGPTNNPRFPPQGSGTYELRKWSLILRFDDGYTQAIRFLASGGGLAEARAIVVAGTELLRRP